MAAQEKTLPTPVTVSLTDLRDAPSQRDQNKYPDLVLFAELIVEAELLERPEVNYLVGWSLGKEKLKSGHYDTLKGSYYINCGSFWRDHVDSGDAIMDEAASNSDGKHHMPEYTAESVWPAETVLRGFRAACEELCCLIIDIAVSVARACDQFGEKKVEGYRQNCLEHVVRTSRTTKARLLHYFPSGTGERTSGGPTDPDDWCGTHLDHGCLTGLTSAMYVDEAHQQTSVGSGTGLNPLDELLSSPDPSAGLYIRSRSGQAVQVKIPKDCLAFQTGEALELMTKGRLKAVPHFVKGVANKAHVARNTLAVFTQPNLDEIVDENRDLDFGSFAKEIVARNT
ncbi:MAG: hypothetical protein Q9159_006265 [Coniocarpon cinnabarinum]